MDGSRRRRLRHHHGRHVYPRHWQAAARYWHPVNLKDYNMLARSLLFSAVTLIFVDAITVRAEDPNLVWQLKLRSLPIASAFPSASSVSKTPVATPDLTLS